MKHEGDGKWWNPLRVAAMGWVMGMYQAIGRVPGELEVAIIEEGLGVKGFGKKVMDKLYPLSRTRKRLI